MLLESELFGHEKGAFTGALERRAGYFELAAAGAIFLDGVIRRLGGKGELLVDVRVVAATNRDAAQAVQDRVREDPYDRINVLNISLPPLRRRLADLELLVDAFIIEFNEKYERQVRSMDGATIGRLREPGWPGNGRELIQRTLESVKNNKTRAAAIPGTTPKTLHNKARRWRCEAAETVGG